MARKFLLDPKHRRPFIEQLERRIVLSTIYYVDPGGATGPIDGLSWATAFNDLQSTIALAQPGDVIRVAEGKYTPTSGTDRNATFDLKDGVEIDGSYGGHYNPYNPAARDYYGFPTIFSGDIGTQYDFSDDSYHVVTAFRTDNTAILDGVAIEAGNANGPVASDHSLGYGSLDSGGGLFVDEGSATIRHCEFISNYATSYGGDVYLSGSTQFTQCGFWGNDLPGAAVGGAAYLAPDFSGTFSNCDFSGLQMDKAPDGSGLAACDHLGSVTGLIENCTFTQLTATQAGGGIYLSGGGGLVINACTFDGNTAGAFGGGMAIYSCNIQVDNCVFSDNYMTTYPVNQPVGAAVATDCGTPFNNCTFADGAGVQFFNSDSTKPSVFSNCVLRFDASNNPRIVLNHSSSSNIFVRNPSPGADAVYGTADDDYGDLELAAYPPSALGIDAGDNSAAPPFPNDIAGHPRFFDISSIPDTGVGTAPIIDLGAYEKVEGPTANAGGPYAIQEGSFITLNGTVRAPQGTYPVYQWDINYNGQTFNPTLSGATPTIDGSTLDGPAVHTIALLVEINGVYSPLVTTTLTIVSAPPTASFVTAQWVAPGSHDEVFFYNPSDPSAADNKAKFTYSYDFNDDGIFDIQNSTSSSAGVDPSYLSTPGPRTVIGRIYDKDGAYSQYSVTINVAPATFATIRPIAFLDWNNNGIYDSRDINNAEDAYFYLDMNNDGRLDSGDSIGPNNLYWLDEVPAGTYVIGSIAKNPTDVQTYPADHGGQTVTVSAGQTLSGPLFGFYPTGLFAYFRGQTIDQTSGGPTPAPGRQVYIDLNDNGVFDAGEPSAISNNEGYYTLEIPKEGTFHVREVVPAGMQLTQPLGDQSYLWQAQMDSATPYSAGVFITTAATGPLGSISVSVFNDMNGNGTQESGENGLAGAQVFIDSNNNGQIDFNEVLFFADGNGQFTFTGIPAGTYTVRELPRPGWEQTYPASNVGYTVTVAAGQQVTGLKFGQFTTVTSISGSVYSDPGATANWASRGAPLAGAELYLDLNNNGTLDSSEPTTVTAADGSFKFGALAPGNYVVRCLPASGWMQTFPLSKGGYSYSISSGQQITGANFLEVQTASISGTFFYDTNGNGIWDSGEAISPSWGVFLDTNGDGIYESGEPELICNSQGQYTFSNLLPGTYRVHPTSATNWTETAPQGGTQVVNAISGQTIANVNFGEVRGAAKTTASSTPLFTGDSYSVNLSYGGFHSVTSWTLNWGDGSIQTITGNPTSVNHTFTSASGTSPFTILAWANTVDGDAPAAPLTLAVYAAPLLNNGLLSLAGTSGNDSVSFTNSSGLLTLNLDGATKQYNSSAVTKVTYSSNGGNDAINLSGAIPATLNLASGNSTVTNNDSSPVFVATGTGKTTINATAGTTIIPANPGTGIQQLAFAAINISSGASVVFANSSATLGDYSNHANRSVAVIDAGGLNIASGGTLDLGDNDMILNYDPANESATRNLIAGLITSGYGTNKNFSGTGLTSSEANFDATQSGGTRAIGWADNADLGKTSFDGVSLSSPNEMLVKFTYYGDCNLDGIVDTGPDLSLFAKGFHAQGSGWDFGDFNYDGPTNNLDLSPYSRGLNSGYKTYGAL